MEIAVDTTLLVDLWRHRSRPERLTDVRQKTEGHTLLLPWMTKAEFLRGALHQRVLEEDAERFLIVFPFISFSHAALLRYARLWTEIAKTGQMVDYPDLWIGAIAQEHSCPVITRNARHFTRIPGLQVIEYRLL